MRINGTVYNCPSGLLKPIFLPSSFSASVVKEQGVYWEGITLTLNRKFYKSRFLPPPSPTSHAQPSLSFKEYQNHGNESWLGTYIVHSETDKQDTTTPYGIRITLWCPSPGRYCVYYPSSILLQHAQFWKLGNITRMSPSFRWSIFSQVTRCGPVARQRKYLMDYKLGYLSLCYALGKLSALRNR